MPVGGVVGKRQLFRPDGPRQRDRIRRLVRT